MSPFLIILLVLSSAASTWLIYKLLSGKRSLPEKVIYCLVLLVPFLGPLLYIFLIEELPPQHPMLRNNGARGDYTQSMISIKADLEEMARQKAAALASEATPKDGHQEPEH